MKPYLLPIIALLFLIPGCSGFGEELRPCPGEEGDLMLSLRLLTVPSDSRSSDYAGHEEVESDLRRLEEGIDISDLVIFLFAKGDKAGGNEKLVARYHGETDLRDLVSEISPGEYTVNLTLDRKELNELISSGSELEPNKHLDLRVVILANTAGLADGAGDSAGDLGSLSYGGLLAQLEETAMDMTSLYADSDGESVTDLYSGNGGKLPMFGTSIFNVSLASLEQTNATMAHWLGEIDMLRAHAKIRLIDNMRDKNANGYPCVRSVAVMSSQQAARLLPHDALHYQNGAQMHTANIHDSAILLVTADAIAYRLGKMPSGSAILPEAEHSGDVFVGYLPEQKIGYADGNVANGLPAYQIKVALGKNEEGEEYCRDYLVPMTSIGTTVMPFGTEILRNHIYSLTVTGLTPEELFVKARIVPWENERHHVNL